MSASSIARLKVAFDAAHTDFLDALSCHDYASLGEALTRELNVMGEFAREIAALRSRLSQESTPQKPGRVIVNSVSPATHVPQLSSHPR
jgi:hypothetical protein